MRVKFGQLRSAYARHAAKRINGPHLPLTNYKQLDYHSCGFIAAMTLCRYFDLAVSNKDILKAVRPTKSCGIDGKRMRRALKDLGITTEFRKDITMGELRKLIKKGIPVLRGGEREKGDIAVCFGRKGTSPFVLACLLR